MTTTETMIHLYQMHNEHYIDTNDDLTTLYVLDAERMYSRNQMAVEEPYSDIPERSIADASDSQL
jgi:hypothetical protein